MDCILGIDIGAGSIKAGVFTPEGKILGSGSAPTFREMKNSDFDNALSQATDSLLREFRPQGIGIGSPGPIDSEGGVISGSANLPYLDNFPIARILGSKTGLPVLLNNDANCSALGEYFFGPGKGSPNLFVFTLGTGLGGGWVWEGKLFRGYLGNGMEVGHTTVRENGALCGCGQKGCAESYFSAKGLLSRYRDRTGIGLVSVAEVFSRVESGEKEAREVLEDGTRVLAEATRNIVNLVNVDTVVYVGGLVRSWHLFGELLESRIRESVFPILESQLRIFHGENQAVLGAGSLILEGKNSPQKMEPVHL